jgi:3-oxoacyl-[acyl-carrier-protein] synthase III
MIIMATATPDMPVASTGVYVATNWCYKCFAYDLQAACSSFCTECQLQQPTFNQEDKKSY